MQIMVMVWLFSFTFREAVAAVKAKEDYMRRHMAGETEEAKKQLAQLAIVRARREAAKRDREAQGRAPGWTKDGVQSSSDSDSDSDDSGAGGKANKAAAAKKGAPVAAKAITSSASSAATAAPPAAKKDPNAVGGNAAAAVAAAAEAAKATNEKKKAAALSQAEADAEAGPPKLKAMDIKKMNGDALKDALKERKLEIQGAKKDLMQRLLDYEAAR
jgi:hypothetical protein